MPRRKPLLVTSEIYHVFNRGVEKRRIFSHESDYRRFIQSLDYYRYESKTRLSYLPRTKEKEGVHKLYVEILCYCLMPNHFHLLLRQISDLGTSAFISRLANSYTKYFNTKYDRVGPLFQGAFKAVRVENDEQLLHLSRYIHLNPLVSGLIDILDKYLWSSYRDYTHESQDRSTQLKINSEEVLSYFKSKKNYESFVLNQADYGRSLEELKYHTLD